MQYKEVTNQTQPSTPWFKQMITSFIKHWNLLMIDLGFKRIHKIKE